MKTGQIFWGVFFLVVGVLLLLVKYDVIYFQWHFLWDLWPVILILWGLALIMKETKIKPVVTILAAVFVGLVVFGFFSDLFNMSCYNDDEWRHEYGIQHFTEEYSQEIGNAKLELSTGAGTFTIRNITDKLVDATVRGEKVNYDFRTSSYQEYANIKLKMKNTNFIFGRDYENKMDVRLNPKPVWDLEFNIGAAKSYFDLRDFKVDKLDLNTGATSTKIILGDDLEKTDVEIEMGAASLEIEIPFDSGCKITGDMVLMLRELNGFRKLDSDYYVTSNYETADNKILIKINGGVSSLEVNRY